MLEHVALDDDFALVETAVPSSLVVVAGRRERVERFAATR